MANQRKHISVSTPPSEQRVPIYDVNRVLGRERRGLYPCPVVNPEYTHRIPVWSKEDSAYISDSVNYDGSPVPAFSMSGSDAGNFEFVGDFQNGYLGLSQKPPYMAMFGGVANSTLNIQITMRVAGCSDLVFPLPFVVTTVEDQALMPGGRTTKLGQDIGIVNPDGSVTYECNESPCGPFRSLRNQNFTSYRFFDPAQESGLFGTASIAPIPAGLSIVPGSVGGVQGHYLFGAVGLRGFAGVIGEGTATRRVVIWVNFQLPTSASTTTTTVTLPPTTPVLNLATTTSTTPLNSAAPTSLPPSTATTLPTSAVAPPPPPSSASATTLPTSAAPTPASSSIATSTTLLNSAAPTPPSTATSTILATSAAAPPPPPSSASATTLLTSAAPTPPPSSIPTSTSVAPPLLSMASPTTLLTSAAPTPPPLSTATATKLPTLAASTPPLPVNGSTDPGASTNDSGSKVGLYAGIAAGLAVLGAFITGGVLLARRSGRVAEASPKRNPGVGDNVGHQYDDTLPPTNDYEAVELDPENLRIYEMPVPGAVYNQGAGVGDNVGHQYDDPLQPTYEGVLKLDPENLRLYEVPVPGAVYNQGAGPLYAMGAAGEGEHVTYDNPPEGGYLDVSSEPYGSQALKFGFGSSAAAPYALATDGLEASDDSFSSADTVAESIVH